MAAVEEFDLAEARVSATTERPRRRRARAVPWLLAAAGLVAVGVVAAPPGGIPLGSLPQDEVAMLAVDVSPAPTELWRADISGWHGEARQIEVLGSTVVVVASGVYGLELATGHVLWREDIPTWSCTVHDAVACVVEAGSPDAVVVRIEADGSSTRIPAPGAVRAVDVDDDVVVLGDSGTDQQARRLNPDGSIVWTVSVQSDLPPGASGLEWASMVVLGERLHVMAGDVVTLDVTNGSLVEEEILAVTRTGDGYLILRSAGAGAYPDRTLVDRDGGVLVEHVVTIPDDDPGSPVEISFPVGTLVTRGDEVLWQDQDAYAVARVGGTLVLMGWSPDGGDAHLSGHDLLTGEELWEQTRYGSVVAAGGSALLLWDDIEGGLHGLDLATGGELWSFGEDPQPLTCRLVPDGLLLLDGSDVVRLAW